MSRTNGTTRRTVVVLAGNQREFEEFCRAKRHDIAQTVHVKSLSDLRGLDHLQVYKTGSWYLMDRTRLAEIIAWLKTRDQVGISEEERY